MRKWIDAAKSLSPSRHVIDQYEADAPENVTMDVEEDGPNGLFLSYLENSGGERGDAAKAMARLCELADQYGVTISLRVAHDKEDEDDASAFLISYYERFGFSISRYEDDAFGGYFMARQPNMKRSSEG